MHCRFGFLGDAFHAVVVRKQLEVIFNYRQKVIGEMLGASQTIY
jgi:hypothetical protein